MPFLTLSLVNYSLRLCTLPQSYPSVFVFGLEGHSPHRHCTAHCQGVLWGPLVSLATILKPKADGLVAPLYKSGRDQIVLMCKSGINHQCGNHEKTEVRDTKRFSTKNFLMGR